MVEKNWLNSAKTNLFSASQEKKNFLVAKNEWYYDGLHDNENAEFDCQLCGHPEIRYEYTIINKLNGNKLIVGSSCINKFIDHVTEENEYLLDKNGKVITKKRLEDDKEKYWKKILFTALDKNFYKNKFQIDITNQIKTDGKLTINQAKWLKNFYNQLNTNEKTAFRNIIKIKLQRKIHKKQYEDLSNSDKEFINLLLSSSQKNILL